jgi:hypothetical protein
MIKKLNKANTNLGVDKLTYKKLNSYKSAFYYSQIYIREGYESLEEFLVSVNNLHDTVNNTENETSIYKE